RGQERYANRIAGAVEKPAEGIAPQRVRSEPVRAGPGLERTTHALAFTERRQERACDGGDNHGDHDGRADPGGKPIGNRAIHSLCLQTGYTAKLGVAKDYHDVRDDIY